MKITGQEGTHKGYRIVITNLTTGEEICNEKTICVIGAHVSEDKERTNLFGLFAAPKKIIMQTAISAVEAAINIVNQVEKDDVEADKKAKEKEEDKPCSLDELKEDVLKDALKAILEGDL